MMEEKDEENEISVPPENSSLKLKIFDLYAQYFTAVKWFGIFPFRYDGSKQFEVKVIEKGLPNFLWRFNYIYLIIYFSKVNLLLSFNHYTQYKYETLKNSYMFQLMFVFGVGLIVSLFFTQALKMRQVASMVSMWLKLERHLADLEEPDEKIAKRLRFLKIQYALYTGTLVSSCMTLTAMGLGVPKFPVFFSSFLIGLNTDADPSYRYYRVSSAGELLTKIIAQMGEAYTGYVGWTILGSFDVLMSMMCRTIVHALDKLHDLVEEHGLSSLQQNINLYSSLRVFVTKMNEVYGRVLFVQELTNMGVSVLLFYGALKENEEVFLTAFFITNGIALTVRMYLLYLPMTSMYTKSLKFKAYLRNKWVKSKLRVEDGGDLGKHVGPLIGVKERDILKGQIETYRFMVFRPWGFHRISSTSIVDYVLAVCSYLVTVKNV